jgi:dipeptidyl-peptidase-4
MKKFLFVLSVVVSTASVFAQKTITIDDCFAYFKFYATGVNHYHYLADGARYAEANAEGIHVFDVRRPDFDSVITFNLPDAYRGFDQFTFNADETKLLLRTQNQPVYRHSSLAFYTVYDLKKHTATPVNETSKQQFAAFSPDGEAVAYVADNNLYVLNLTNGVKTAVTLDGKANHIINGLPDWVYEEEFSAVDGDGMKATVWSPDSRYVGYLRFDETDVREYPMFFYENGMYPRKTTFKYPKVGEKNANVSTHVFDRQTGATYTVALDPAVVNTRDFYLPRIHWTPDNRLVVSHFNRYQDTLTLLVADPAKPLPDRTLASSVLLRETDPAYVEIESENKLLFLQNGKQFVWTSERSGFMHIYLYELDGKTPPRALTEGAFDVTAFYGVDEKNGTFYYQAALPDPMNRSLFEGYLDGRPPRQLNEKTGWNEAEFSTTFDYYKHTWSDANTPTEVTLRQRSGTVMRTLADNRRAANLRRDYGFVEKQFFTVKNADSTALNAWMLRPAVLEPGKKYPVLFDVYGGPGSQTVQNQYDGYVGAWHQMLVQKGVIVVSVDNRGTGARGTAFKKCTQLQLGKYETEDQIAAARYLGNLPYVDANRIGIWGWSFGGYLSTSCVLKGNDVFKMAMAVAPVVNWKWYDTAYTERYMHTTADNAEGYETNAPINYVSRLRGGNYLLCHGTTDDNVHYQQAAEMINALVKNNKQFETHYYPNRNHGIYGDNATRHLFTKLTAFVLETL